MTSLRPTRNRRETASRAVGYMSLVSVAVFPVLLVLLYFLEPEFNPPHLISEYQLGHFGWLMSLAFVCLGSGSLFLSRALWPDLRTRGGRLGRSWLLLVGIAYVGAGIFAPNPVSVIESRLHGLSGIIVIFSSPVVFTLLINSLVHDQRWSEVTRLLKWTTLLAWLGLLSFYASIIFYGLGQGQANIVVGWTNRFMIAAYCAWLATVAWQAIKFCRHESE